MPRGQMRFPKIGNLSIYEVVDKAENFAEEYEVAGPNGTIRIFPSLYQAQKFAEGILKMAEAVRNQSQEKVVNDVPEYVEVFQVLEEEEKRLTAEGMKPDEIMQAMKDFKERIATHIENTGNTSFEQEQEQEEEIDTERPGG